MDMTRELLQKAAYDSSSKCAITMVNRALRRFPLPIYKLNVKIMMKYPYSATKNPRKRFSIKGKVIGRNIPLSKYQIEYVNPKTKFLEKDWLLVSDITSLTVATERNRKKYTNVEELLRAANRERKNGISVLNPQFRRAIRKRFRTFRLWHTNESIARWELSIQCHK